MPRPLRIEYEGAWYHVMNRGANRQNIFLSDKNRQTFLSLLKDITEKFYVEIHAYCLMNNHYHLLIRTKIANLGKAMRHLDSIYTQRFNRLEKRDGPLFKGRYKAILVEADAHLLQLSRYIHLNPVIAKICKYVHQFKWSSYPIYIKKNKKPTWLTTKFILRLHNNYSKFVNEGLDAETDQFYRKQHLPSIFGSDKFITEKLLTIKKNYKTACLTDINRTKKLPTIDDIANCVSKYFNLPLKELKKSTRGKKNIGRMIAIYLSRQLGQLTHQTIADYFTNINRRSIGKILSRCEIQLNNNKLFKCHLTKLIKRLK